MTINTYFLYAMGILNLLILYTVPDFGYRILLVNAFVLAIMTPVMCESRGKR